MTRLIDADALGMDMWIQMGIVYGEDIGKAFADIVRNAPTIDAVPREKYERLLEAANEMDEALKWYQEEEDRRLSGEID